MHRPWFLPDIPPPSVEPAAPDEDALRELAERHGDEVASLVRTRWLSTRSFNIESRRGVRSLYNVRLGCSDPRGRVFSALDAIFARQAVAFKINASVGLILRHKRTGAYRYFHPSDNNARIFNAPVFVTTREDLLQIREAMDPENVLSESATRCPDSSWSVITITHIAIYIYHHMHHPIGTGPRHKLQGCWSPRQGPGARQNLCFFKCLHTSLQRGAANMRLVNRNALQLFHMWRPGRSSADFRGVTDEDLPSLERLFKLQVFVYTLHRSGSTRCAVLVRRPLDEGHSPRRARMDLHRHGQHYSLILDMGKYAATHKCRHCGQIFRSPFNAARHEKTCLSMSARVFKGGPFHVTKNVFQTLEDCGVPVTVPPSHRFYPFRATFDIETMQQKVPEGSGAGLLSEHVLMSISVASNVPCYERAVCLISDGDPLDLTRRFLAYLGRIAKQAEKLVRQEMAPVILATESARAVEARELPSCGNGAPGWARTPVAKAYDALRRWLGTLPCFAFNGSKYDLVVLKPYIAALWSQGKLPEELTSATKKSLTCHERDIFPPYQDLELERWSGLEAGEEEEEEEEECEESLDNIVREHEEEQSERGARARKRVRLNVVAKSGSNIVSLALGNLQFLDVCSYLAPGVSYAKYLKAYGVDEEQQGKSYFPYDYIDSLERLNETTLPPYEAFYSRLKNANVLDENQGELAGRRRHGELLELWKNKGMKTFRDFLEHYNNADVGPFILALERQSSVYRDLGLDMAKDAVTLPGLAMKYSFRELGGLFHTFHQDESDLHGLVMQNIVGGPSIVFKRLAEAGRTRIRPLEAKDGRGRPCKSIIGLDCNALYLFALSQDMPTGPCVVRRAPDFEPHCSSKKGSYSQAAIRWLQYVARATGRQIRHALNEGEVRLGVRRLPVDGFDHRDAMVFQFDGCLYHGCHCLEETEAGKAKLKQWEHATGVTQEQRRYRTRENHRYVTETLGYKLTVMKECEWTLFERQYLAPDRPVAGTKTARGALPAQGPCTTAEIVSAVARGDLFGLCLVDITVPPWLRPRFAEMPPIFKKANVGRQDIGPLMAKYAAEHDILPKPRQMLISSYFGEKILLATPLLRWYMRHGLVVTSVHLVMEYEPKSCFDELVNTVTAARREADRDKSRAILGDTYKLIGNAVFGKTGECKSRREHRTFATTEEARTFVNRSNFRDIKRLRAHTSAPLNGARRGEARDGEIEELAHAADSPDFESEASTGEGDEVLPLSYEVVMGPRKIVEDLPVHISFYVYQYAKLKMLELRYDFMERFFDKSKWEQLYMDTDSNYMACSVEELEDALLPRKRREYFEEVHHWLPTPVCDVHRQSFVECKTLGLFPWRPLGPCCEQRMLDDNRTPGLFKTEWQGKGLVALCSKTYFGDGDTHKFSCKGLQKGRNSLTYATYKSVLETGVSAGGVNSGFRWGPQGRVVTYEQPRAALGYFYGKRQVLDDGVHTSPLTV